MNSQPPKLVLASTSTYRAALLDRLGVSYTQQAPLVEESMLPSEDFASLAGRLARKKAAAVDAPDSLVIGSDQVAVLGQQQLHKPGTIERAHAQLHECSGNSVQFFTGVALLNTVTGNVQSSVVHYQVAFRVLNDAEIRRYVTHDNPLDCAGSFKWERLGIALMASLEGPDPTALEGLPLIALCKMLRKAGLEIP
ncbi:MAG: Maf family protein [Luminiphilus sp.]